MKLNERKTTIIIAEDHVLVRKAYIELLNNREDYEIIGEADNGEQLLNCLQIRQPDIVLLDILMPVMSGGQALEQIKKMYPGIKNIIISSHNSDAFLAEYFLKGANAYITKDTEPEKLFEAIDKVIKDEYYFTKDISKILINHVVDSKKIAERESQIEFSDTELCVLKLICKEKTTQEIADEMKLKIYAIDHIRRKLLIKTQKSTLIGLYKYALKKGITDIED